MTEVQNQTLDQAMSAISALKGTIPDEQLEALYSRLMSSPEEMREEIEGEIRENIESEYELEADEGFPVSLIVETDRAVSIGQGKHEQSITIRNLHMGDFERMANYIPDLVRVLYKKGPNTLKNLTAQKLLNDVIRKGLAPKTSGKFKKVFYTELALCLSNQNTDQIVSSDILRSSRPGQIMAACKALWEENQLFFTDLWAEVPGGIRTQTATSIGKVIAIIKGLGQKSLAFNRVLDGLGGTLNGGTTNSSSPSQSDSQTQKSEDSTSSRHGATKSQSTVRTRKKAMSAGKMAKASLIPKGQEESQA